MIKKKMNWRSYRYRLDINVGISMAYMLGVTSWRDNSKYQRRRSDRFKLYVFYSGMAGVLHNFQC